MKLESLPSVHDTLYSALLYLYPAEYRREFAEEMREVFSQAMADASSSGSFVVGLLLTKELLNLPVSALRVHTQVRNTRRVSNPSASPAVPLEFSWRELLVVLAVFLLPAMMILANPVMTPALETTQSAGKSAVLLFLGVMIAAGLLRGVPLWSVPYLGIVLVIAGYLYLFQWIANLVSPALISNFSPGQWDRSTYLLLKVISNGMLWLMLFCLTLLVVALLALLNRFQPLFSRTRHDWTMLSYILYGESVFALLFLFENHRFDRSFIIASIFCLGIGLWFYLRSVANWKRLLALLAGLSLAMWIAVFGTASSTAVGGALGEMLTLNQARSIFDIRALNSPAGLLLLIWVGMLIMLLLPTLLARRPALFGPGSQGGENTRANYSI
jgi:hypothetical protein